MDTSGIIKALGAGSGIDTNNLVKELAKVERAPVENRLNREQEQLETQISSYGTLKSSLAEFKKAFAGLAKNDTFNARSVTLPETSTITADSVDPGAQTGTYQIEVNAVAQAQSLVSTAAVADKDRALDQSGKLTISLGTWSYDASDNPTAFAANAARPALDISVEEGDSLQKIADKINKADSGVQATIIRADDKYQLMLSAPSGAANAIQITSDDATKGDTEGLSTFEFNAVEHSGMTQTQAGKDAELKINGLDVKRDSNEISDVIKGFHFTINKAAPGEKLNFTVSPDSSGAEKAVREFVSAYNLFHKTASTLTGFSKDEKTNATVKGSLINDGTAKATIDSLRSTLTNMVPGVKDGYSALTNIGIRTEKTGELSINEEEFKASFKNNFSQIESLFAQSTSSSNDQVKVGAGTYASKAKAGDFKVNIEVNPEKATVSGAALDNSGKVQYDSSTNALTAFSASAGDSFAFKVKVDGKTTSEIKLDGSYSNIENLRADLQARINGDASLKDAGISVDVAFADGKFSFTSNSYGSTSEVTFSDVGTDMQEILGSDMTTLSDKGVDVKGTINGVEGFGAGNVLLPDLKSDAYGLNFTIGDKAKEAGEIQTSFSRGIAGEMIKTIDNALSSEGSIKMREDSMNNDLKEISEERLDLERHMELYTAQLQSKYAAMERIISSFKGSGDLMTGLIDRLPYTSKS